MKRERRNAERVRVYLDTIWGTRLAKNEGIIRDISKTGCFIMTLGEAALRETISIELKVPAMFNMTLRGTVVNKVQDLGFAIRFKDLNVTERSLLERLVEHFKKNPAS